MSSIVDDVISKTVERMAQAKGWKLVKEDDGAFYMDVPKTADEFLLQKVKAFIQGITNGQKTLKVKRV